MTRPAYGTYFFEMANVGNPFMNSCILVSVGVVAIFINLGVMVRYGRRRIFLTWGLIICGFCQLIIAVVYQKHPGTNATGKVIVAVSVIYIFVYNVSLPTFPILLKSVSFDINREQSVHSHGFVVERFPLNDCDLIPLVSLLRLDSSVLGSPLSRLRISSIQAL
jgi:hypothetical protein